MKHLPSIVVSTRPPGKMRYISGGDYDQTILGSWWINIAENEDWRYEALCLVHELVEMILTKDRCIEWDDITKFDMDHPELDDPGNNDRAPYNREHLFATRIEQLLCQELNINWEDYDKSYENMQFS